MPVESLISVARFYHQKGVGGFTLVEVLIAMAITAFVAMVSYSSLSAVISGVEGTREEAEQVHEISRAMGVLSRDLRQSVDRSVIDDFGQPASALEGGPLASMMLSLTRAGWHNTVGTPRSALQRVGYFVEEETLIRVSWPILDRTGAVEPNRTVLLENVDNFRVRFLSDVASLQVGRDLEVDRRLWAESWLADVSTPGAEIERPAAVEVLLEVEGWGELERLYVLPPL